MPVIDISKITLDNINDYQPVFKSKKVRGKFNNIKEYQHQYYLEVTKLKRKLIKDGLVEKVED
jgi:hypothetical protein